jgi:hypothetical protein
MKAKAQPQQVKLQKLPKVKAPKMASVQVKPVKSGKVFNPKNSGASKTFKKQKPTPNEKIG